jgi:hyperpolarization activated cyclic nucleotide-gated potassium channel 2
MGGGSSSDEDGGCCLAEHRISRPNSDRNAPFENGLQVFPEYIPSRFYDEPKKGWQWPHSSSSRRFWEYLIFAITLITPIEISYIFLFDKHLSLAAYSPFFLLDILQLIDNFVLIRTPVARDGILTSDVGAIVRHYGRVAFIVHLIGSVPLGWIGRLVDDLDLYILLSLNRLLRLHRAYKAWHTIYPSTFYTGTFSLLFSYTIAFIFILHFFACLVYVLAADFQENHGQSFITPWRGRPPIEQYTASLYFVMTTLSTVGFGDLRPVSIGERLVTMAMEVVGIALQAFIIAKMLVA